MNRNSFAPLVALLLIVLLMSIPTTVFALPDASPVQQTSLPQITFLGQGPGTFTVEPPLKLLVKTYQNNQFLFVALDEVSYKAKANERVWTIDVVPNEPIRLFDELKSFGNVQAGCEVNYVQIEDNIDTRRNTFYINGNVLQVVEQGWVTYGSFTVPESGELTFFAEDSIGMVIELCQTVQTVVPSDTPTVEASFTPTPTSTVPVVTETPTITLTPTGTSTAPGVEITLTPTETPTGTVVVSSPTATNTPTATGVVSSPTPTSTSTAPGVEISLTPTVTSTAPGVQISLTPTNTVPATTATVTNTPGQGQQTQTPTSTAPAIQITATPRATVGSFPVTGGGPGPREIGAIGAGIIGMLLLVGAGWWFLLRGYFTRR